MDGKKWIALLLALVMSVSLFACGAKPADDGGDSQDTPVTEDATRVFKDSCGREVTVPVNVEKVAISGPLAQIVVFALAPDKLVGIANAWDESAAEFLDTRYYDLPLLGQLYGGKGEMNLEMLLAAAPDVVIDVGEPKGSIAEDMDGLQEQTGIPFLHIDAYLWQCPTRRRVWRTTAASPMTALWRSRTAWRRRISFTSPATRG